jgi:hypothetical protein
VALAVEQVAAQNNRIADPGIPEIAEAQTLLSALTR